MQTTPPPPQGRIITRVIEEEMKIAYADHYPGVEESEIKDALEILSK